MPIPFAFARATKDWCVPPRSTAAELLDGDGHDRAELAVNFRDIRRVNQLLGGTATILRHLPQLIDRVPGAGPISILDLATGSADIPVAVVRWATERGRAVSITASDSSDEILELARHEIAGRPEISLVRCDARWAPLPDRQFDIVLCSLSLHHFTPEDAVLVLREMDRLSRYGFILNDLRRGRLGYIAARAAARATTRNRLTRHDAPLSVLRAYTPSELKLLVEVAGIKDASISTNLWFRMAAVTAKGADDV